MRQEHDLSQGRKVLAYPPMWSSGICCPLQCPCRGQESPRVSPWDELRSQKETIRRNSRAQAGPGPSARPGHLKREAEIFRKLGVGRQELAWKRPSTGPSSSAPLAKQSFHRTDGETEAHIGLLPWQPRPVAMATQAGADRAIRPHLPLASEHEHSQIPRLGLMGTLPLPRRV